MRNITAPKKPLLVFDVNETLLDLEKIAPIFERIFGEKLAMRRWYADLILYSEALTLAKVYASFTDISAALLQMMASTRGISITEADKRELFETFASMPPYAEVPAALERLRDAGFRLFALTNGQTDVLARQLGRGGIIQYFENVFSIDQVQRYKPAPEAYAYVEAQLGTKPADLMLVACHAWDTLGAVAAGWRAALIKRPGNDVLGVGPQPELTGTDLTDIAAQLTTMYTVS
ncbi:MAG: haloacid dehalogenase type II [Candidatus Aquilonibacter sp.]